MPAHWAFLLHRNWCKQLSDLGYRTQGTLCDINAIPSLDVFWVQIHTTENNLRVEAVRAPMLKCEMWETSMLGRAIVSHTHAHTCSCYVLSHVQSWSSHPPPVAPSGSYFWSEKMFVMVEKSSQFRFVIKTCLWSLHCFKVSLKICQRPEQLCRICEGAQHCNNAVVFSSDGPTSAPTVTVAEKKKKVQLLKSVVYYG